MQNGTTDVNFLFSFNVRFLDMALSFCTTLVKPSFKIEN
jgi:hypothetical protein